MMISKMKLRILTKIPKKKFDENGESDQEDSELDE